MKSRTLLLLIMTSVFLFVGKCNAHSQTNLIKNGNAESGNNENWSKTVKLSSGSQYGGKYCFKRAGYIPVLSSQLIPVEQGKIYTLSGWFRSIGKIKSKIYFGYLPFDANKQRILSYHVSIFQGTETTLVDACKPEDTILKVKDGRKWKKLKFACVAFEADNSGKYKDLPNRSITPLGIKKISRGKGFWEVHLTKPCGKAYPAGTPVREHKSGSTYIYNAASGRIVPKKWTQYTNFINGWAKSGVSLKEKWWAGTKYVKIVVLVNHGQKSNARLLWDDLTLTSKESKETVPPVFETDIRSLGTASFKLDLAPGLYQIKAKTDSDNHLGMGISMLWKDTDGSKHGPIDIPVINEKGKSLYFNFQVPRNSVSFEIDLHNADVSEFRDKQNKWRNWKYLGIRKLKSRQKKDAELLWDDLAGTYRKVNSSMLIRYAEDNSAKVFHEDFEKSSLENWTISKNYTTGSADIVSVGQLSSSSLEIDKKDTRGELTISRNIPLEGGKWYRLTMDVQTIKLLPGVEFYVLIEQKDSAGMTLGKVGKAPFYDGITKPGRFGGLYKAPQTLGKWITDQYTFKLNKKTVSISLSICVATSGINMRIDNVILKDLGAGKLRETIPPIFETDINSPGIASLDLDLVPGFTYQLKAKTDSQEHRSMGINMLWKDFEGKLHGPTALPVINEEGKNIYFNFQVPYNSVSVTLDLHNADTIAIKNNPKKWRNWKYVGIRLLKRLMCQKNQYLRYKFRNGGNREQNKPRDLIELSEADKENLKKHLSKRSAVDACVVKINGGMVFKIGGKIIPPVFSAGAINTDIDASSELCKNNIAIIRITLDNGGSAKSGDWSAPGKYDFSAIDDDIYRMLVKNPNAYVILEPGGLYTPFWWGEMHQDELLRDDRGLYLSVYNCGLSRRAWGPWDNGNFGRAHEDRYKANKSLKGYETATATTFFPSPASKLYRKAMGNYLVALRKYIEKQPYGNAIIGYQLIWGYDTQWQWPQESRRVELEYINGKFKKTYPRTMRLDYSPAMLKYFHNFLIEKYKTVEALRKAWNNKQVTFENATIPSAKERRPRTKSPRLYKYIYDDMKKLRRVADYNICYRNVIGSLLNDMGAAVKQAGSRKILIGAYFQEIKRDMGQDLVVNQPYVDFVGGPDYYADALGLPGICPFYQDTWRLHKKIVLKEIDSRVFPAMYMGNPVTTYYGNARESLMLLRRETARQMCSGGGYWFLDMTTSQFMHPTIGKMIGSIQKVFEKVLKYDRSSPAQMAIFFNSTSYNVSMQFGWHAEKMTRDMLASIRQSGVPIDSYRMCDLEKVADKYKVFIFPMAFGLTDSERKIINSLKKDGNLLVFGNAAGYVGEYIASCDLVSSITGINMKQDNSLEWTVKVTNTEHPVSKQMTGFTGTGNLSRTHVHHPMFHVVDPKAESLGEYTGPKKGRTGFAIKDNGSWQSIYLGSFGYPPPSFFRGLARYKKLHIYNSNDETMFFAKELVAIHAASDGLKTIELPRKANVTSLWDNKKLGRMKTIRKTMRAGENALYLVK